MGKTDFEIVCSKIENEKEFLNCISQKIWNKPELRYNEIFAHETLTSALIKHGFEVKKSFLLPTAFRAEYSSGEGPTIAVLLEYDALPEIGHACGHNLIAEAGLAAGMAIKAAMEADKAIKGKLVLLGTPAEESGGGKIKLIKGGAFKDIDAAIMVHPCNVTRFSAVYLSRLSMTVQFQGKEAHASASPWEGLNALDAAVSFYQSVGLLRQQIKPTCRIHAIITKGGTAPNVIPAETEIVLYIRAPTRAEVSALDARVVNCIRGAATATGCTYTFTYDKENQYDDVISNETMRDLFAQYAQKLGIEETRSSSSASGSTDMGNVSYVVPSIHALYSIDQPSAFNHTKEFTVAAGALKAQGPTLAAAKAMAMTVLALYRDPEKLSKARVQFEKATK